MDIKICEVIREKRKERGISQEVLSEALGISVQAVSKWETQNSLPDILLLPYIAEYFNISMDHLFFGKESPILSNDKNIKDDGKLRIVQYYGNELISKDNFDIGNRIELKLDDYFKNQGNNILNVEIWGSADIQGDISGDLNAGCSVNCGNVNGCVNAADSINCGNVCGPTTAGDSVNCGNVCGPVSANDSVNCGSVGGSVTAGDNITCGDIGGDIQSCNGDIRCKIIAGNVSCQGNIIYE